MRETAERHSPASRMAWTPTATNQDISTLATPFFAGCAGLTIVLHGCENRADHLLAGVWRMSKKQSGDMVGSNRQPNALARDGGCIEERPW